MNTPSSSPARNVLHRNRMIRSSFGIVKMPFTLAKPLKLSTLQKKLSVHGVVKTVKMSTNTTGWVHYAKYTPKAA